MAHSFKTRGCRSSGPAEPPGSKHDRSLVTLSIVKDTVDRVEVGSIAGRFS